MDYGKVLRRAWDTVWRYKALWIFGAILAMTAGGGGSSASSYRFSQGDFRGWEYTPDLRSIPPGVVPLLIGFGIALLVELVILIVVVIIARYVAETSLIGMVDVYEETGEKRRVGRGFRMGWSRTAWRLFLIDLVIGVPTAVAFLLLFALLGAPSLLWLTGNPAAGTFGTVVSVLLFFPVVLLAIVVGTVLGVLMRFFRRACVIEGLGVTASVRRGFRVARQRWENVAVQWLIMLGIGIGWAIVTVILIIILLPLFILLAIVGILLGGMPALLAYWLASLATGTSASWVPYVAAAGVGLAFGVPVFMIIAGAPWFFVNGLMEVFKSSVWTQTYREIRAVELVAPAPLPEPAELPEEEGQEAQSE